MTTLREAIESLKARHIEYIEATYHVRHSQIIKERREILNKIGGVVSDVWIEGTPSYKLGPTISDLKIPDPIKELLMKFHEKGLGVYDPPYLHQSTALEAFFDKENPKDLVVATGTGSGKTEIFLYSILGSMILEGKRNRTTKKRGFRAIILYPMNALVSDQLSRLRRTLGDEESASIIKSYFGRTAQFGMYTSRTPYHGEYDSAMNDRNVKPLIKYFVEMKQSEERRGLFNELQKRGRVPQKNLEAFLSGRSSSRDSKYRTQPEDRELFTRQEMHSPNENGGTPDVLVTNYSMLEYMLLRPIEQPLFDSTRQWLEEDPDNQLLIVIDEAHLYRGAQGAEVSLLIRRLLNHLKITRDRVRCILTSASLGEKDAASEVGKKFAAQLTGGRQSDFQIIQGERVRLGGEVPIPGNLGKALQPIESDLNPESLSRFYKYFGWEIPTMSGDNELRLNMGINLLKTPEFKAFHDVLSGKPQRLSKVGELLFPDLEENERNAAVLNMALVATWAQKDTDVPLYPVRIHSMFRGIPKLYACTNRHCIGRQSLDPDSILGPLFTTPRESCEYCHSRVFELMGHRTCGAIYISAYFNKDEPGFPKFLWTQDEDVGNLQEVHLLLEEPRNDPDFGDVENDTHISLNQRIAPKYIDVRTGYIRDEVGREKDSEYLKCWWPPSPPSHRRRRGRASRSEEPEEQDEGFMPLSWKRCYACGIDETRAKRTTLIMDHETRGEEPFANIVKTMFKGQPPAKDLDAEMARLFPNKGRKILCFSDGRQKAARLARDLQRTIEQDSFKELLLLAAQKASGETPLASLFPWVVRISYDISLVLFDNGDGLEGSDYEGSRQRFIEAQNDIPRLMSDYGLESKDELLLNMYIREEISSKKPHQFDQALLRALGDTYFSIRQTMIGYVAPLGKVLEKIISRNGSIDSNLVRNIVLAVINNALENRVLDRDIRKEDRILSRKTLSLTLGYTTKYDDGLTTEMILPEKIRHSLETLNEEQIRKLESSFRLGDNDTPPLFNSKEGRYWLNPYAVTLLIDVKEDWKRCKGCGKFSPFDFSGKCPDVNCRGEMTKVDDNDLYVKTRKDFLKTPILEVLGIRKPTRLPFTIRSEEHSAQLNSKDTNEVFGKAERYELLFQDVLLDDIEEHPQPIDVLSCTTTMEVGIDIGSLTGVALRTVPPRPDNYQQRSGRAGRRGSAVSMISTFADNSPHEMYMFEDPSRIISAEVTPPTIYIQNLKILQRHINATLIQEFFQRITESSPSEDARKWNVFESLGKSGDFFMNDGPYSFESFKLWMKDEIILNSNGLSEVIANIVPDEISAIVLSDSANGWKKEIISNYAKDFVNELRNFQGKGDWSSQETFNKELLSNLLEIGLLPTFGFPLDLCEFTVRDYDRSGRRFRTAATRNDPPIIEKYSMSQNLAQALSEYVPGREVVVDKHTFVSYGLYIPFTRNKLKRARSIDWDNLDWLNYCKTCNIVLEDRNADLSAQNVLCQQDHKIESIPRYSPEGFAPEVEQGRGAVEERTNMAEKRVYTQAELPTPIGLEVRKGRLTLSITNRAEVRSMPDQPLVIRNYGPYNEGYKVCMDCGAISFEDDPPSYHNRPYQLESWLITSPRMKQCNGDFTSIAFAHDFRTDLAILSISHEKPLDFAINEPWATSAARSLSEALVLGATRTLGIDAAELAGNWRYIGKYVGDKDEVTGHIEFYLYDTTPGGAGFANETASRFAEVLSETRKILENCDCESSCHKCIRTYNNRYFHNTLTRQGALTLLNYVETEKIGSIDEKLVRELLDRVGRVIKLYEETCVLETTKKTLNITLKQKRVVLSIRSVFLENRDELTSNSFGHVDSNRIIINHEVTDYDVLHRMPKIVGDILGLLSGD